MNSFPIFGSVKGGHIGGKEKLILMRSPLLEVECSVWSKYTTNFPQNCVNTASFLSNSAEQCSSEF